VWAFRSDIFFKSVCNSGTIVLCCLFSAFALRAQTPADLSQIAHFRETNEHRLLQEYVQFLSIPNTANDSLGLLDNANFILQMLERRGIKGRLLPGTSKGAVPAVYGEVKTPGATTTVAFYAHYDGQPVSPEKWAPGLAPFKPVFATTSLEKGGRLIATPKTGEKIDPDWRLYGRASADDKAGVFAILAAYEALKTNKLAPGINIKFLFEGEEESGSTHLDEIFQNNKELLKADVWVIADGPMHVTGRKQIVFGVRGDVNMDLTVYGAKRPLHSGNYGNWAPNPAFKLAELLATMKDSTGRVLIDGFYDDVAPLSELEKQALKNIPDPEPKLRQELAVARPDGGGLPFLELIMTLPTLNVNGFRSADVGRLASNIIPVTATATLDLRLVKGQDAQRQQQKVIRHLQKKGYCVIDRAPTDEERLRCPNIATVEVGTGYNAQRTSMDLPIAKKIAAAVQVSSADPLILVPSAGGSLPLFLFEKYLNAPPLTIPVVNYDNNQHGENENVRIGALWGGIESMAAIMLMR
jgi:acetylornithine deacetylase/succinyl-diaminopimelate desuccinylase-like protein